MTSVELRAELRRLRIEDRAYVLDGLTSSDPVQGTLHVTRRPCRS